MNKLLADYAEARKRVTVLTNDARLYTGSLFCLDQTPNIVLFNSTETQANLTESDSGDIIIRADNV